MDGVIEIVGLGGLVAQAVKLIRGCEIELLPPQGGGSQGTFVLAVFSALPLLKIYERYALGSTAPSSLNRRDLRFGQAQGKAYADADGNIVIDLSWAEPYTGTSKDTVKMVGEELHITSTVTVKGRTASYNSIHTRQR